MLRTLFSTQRIAHIVSVFILASLVALADDVVSGKQHDGVAAAGCAAVGGQGLTPLVMLAMVLLHLRRGGAGSSRTVLEAPKSRIVSRVFIAWPFDGASADASANDAAPTQALMVRDPQPALPQVSVHAIADLTPMTGPANDVDEPMRSLPRHSDIADAVAAYLKHSEPHDRRVTHLSATARTAAVRLPSDDIITRRRASPHAQPGTRGHVFDVAAEESAQLGD